MFVLSSPSGAGKTTLSRMLLKADRHVELSISVTTRPQRRGGSDGRDYHLIVLARFAFHLPGPVPSHGEGGQAFGGGGNLRLSLRHAAPAGGEGIAGRTRCSV